jgi:prophage regulatory protein
MKILRPKQIAKLLGISRVQLWRWQRAGLFPNFVELGPRSRGLLESQVVDWINSRPKTQSWEKQGANYGK